MFTWGIGKGVGGVSGITICPQDQSDIMHKVSRLIIPSQRILWLSYFAGCLCASVGTHRHTDTHTDTQIHTHTHTDTHIHTQTHTYTHRHTHTHTDTHIHTQTHTDTHRHTQTHTHTDTHTHTHTNRLTLTKIKQKASIIQSVRSSFN